MYATSMQLSPTPHLMDTEQAQRSPGVKMLQDSTSWSKCGRIIVSASTAPCLAVRSEVQAQALLGVGAPLLLEASAKALVTGTWKPHDRRLLLAEHGRSCPSVRAHSLRSVASALLLEPASAHAAARFKLCTLQPAHVNPDALEGCLSGGEC